MEKLILFLVFSYAFILSLHQVMCMKCRTGNQQSDDQFQKIMQVCRRRYLGYDRDNARDYNARDTDSQESSDSDSDEDVFENKFLTSSGNHRNNKNDKSSGGNSGAGRYDYYSSNSSPNSNHQSSRSNWNSRSYSSNNRSSNDNGQANSKRNGKSNGMDSRGYADNNNGYSNRYNGNMNNNNNNNNMNRNNNNNNYNNNNNNEDNNDGDGEHEQACIIQCFFNELNIVDQRGFPEKSSVIGIMTQNVQDPELRDFIEESVMDCYHYLSNNGRQEKCQFSQSLLTCLADKGSERCEDWDDE